VPSVLAPNLGKLHKEFPDIVLDVTTDNNRRDIVSEGFNAGIHFGEFIEKDMIVVRVSPDHRPAILGSSDYFKTHPKPKQRALQGLGLAYVAEHDAASYLTDGKLLRVLQDWCQPFQGFFIYYPSRRQQTAALTALVNVLRVGR